MPPYFPPLYDGTPQTSRARLSISSKPIKWFRRSSKVAKHTDSTIYHVAALLSRLPIPADIIPIVLDYAEFWIKCPAAERRDKCEISHSKSRTLYLSATLPPYMAPNSLRKIIITTDSNDQFWSWGEMSRSSITASWFEAVMFNSDKYRIGDIVDELGRDFYHNTPADPAHRLQTTEWRWDTEYDDDGDENTEAGLIQNVFRQLNERRALGIIVCAGGHNCRNQVRYAKIEFAFQPVRRM